MEYSDDPYIRSIQEHTEARGQGGGFTGDVGRALGGVKSFLFGGKATEGMPTAPQNYSYSSGYIKDQLGNVGGRPAPMFNSLDAAQARAEQMSLANMLRQTAGGQRAGAGELAVNRQVGQAQAAQQAQVAGARGQNAALAQRNAARNVMQLGTTGAGMAQQAQMQDQQAAQGQLGALLGGMRSQDIGIGQGDQNSQLQQTQMNQNAQLGYLQSLLGWDQAALQQDLAKRGIQMQDKGMFPSLLAAGGQVAAASAGKPA